MSKTRALICVLAPALVLACSDVEEPLGPRVTSPEVALATLAPIGPTGIKGFRFVPPIAKEAPTPGDRDNSLLDLLTIEICEWNGTACVLPLVRSLSSQPGPHGRIELSGNDIYRAQWKTLGDALDPTRNYRIRVLASGGEIGHADVDILASEKEQSPEQPGYVRLVAGSTLPIGFIIRKGAGARAGAPGGTFRLASGVTLDVPPGALTQDVFLTAMPATNLPPGNLPLVPGTGWDFGPDGLVFAHPVVMTIAYDPAAVPAGVPESELRIHKLVSGSYEQQDAGLVDLVNHTVSAEVDGFSVYVVLQRDPQNPEDLEPPVVTALEVRNLVTPTFGSATTLDVSAGDATLFTRITLTDNGVGVNWIDLRWVSPTGRQVRFPCYRGGPPDLGSDTNGEWECQTIFPEDTEGGLWQPQVIWLRDNVQNQALFVQQPGGFCQTTAPTNCLTNLPQVTVNSTTPDLIPPVLQSLAVSLDVQPRAFGPSVSVDASMGARRVWFGFQATDNLSGLGGYQPFDYFWLVFSGPNNQPLDFIGSCTLTQGTRTAGFWECFVTVPAQAQTGAWRLTRLRVPDRVGNGGWSGNSDFVPNGSGQLCNPGGTCVASPTVQVTSSGDGEAPALQTLGIQESPSAVTTTLGLTDNLSGVSFVRVQYTSAVTTQFQECFPQLTTGTATNGTWECTITFSPAAARGQWFLNLQVIDVAGNTRFYTRRQSDGFLCYFDPVLVAQVCQDFGDTDLILQ